jgi:hypothetical protein
MTTKKIKLVKVSNSVTMSNECSFIKEKYAPLFVELLRQNIFAFIFENFKKKYLYLQAPKKR